MKASEGSTVKVRMPTKHKERPGRKKKVQNQELFTILSKKMLRVISCCFYYIHFLMLLLCWPSKIINLEKI